MIGTVRVTDGRKDTIYTVDVISSSRHHRRCKFDCFGVLPPFTLVTPGLIIDLPKKHVEMQQEATPK